MDRIFSGIQPTGNLHLGNYLGAVQNWVKLQSSYECIYCIVDMHAITTFQKPETLIGNILEVASILIASGIDINNSILFNQSRVAMHAELAWIFNCTAKIGWLNRMTQFKDKAGKNREKASAGLYVYPNLMAADILAYKATHVPVGDDQKQHLELTRDIATSFNDNYKTDFFPLVEPLILGEATRVMNLRDGSKKMSKSDESDFSRINITDSAEKISAKIKKAKTDSLPVPDSSSELSNRLEAKNLIGIFAALRGISLQDIIKDYGGGSFSVLKDDLTECIIEELQPVGKEIKELLNNKDELDKILKDGAERAKEISRPVVNEVKNIVGFLT
ncbi:MAG: Tryptophan--tRNA ligase [Alphaproteobacteria bacterium MarineAlpha2_Bin1]|nr:MAG: Tryptophan--tRNA ligase [Alphaproteobacteria bacterium MarineAlpha2_Bin1]